MQSVKLTLTGCNNFICTYTLASLTHLSIGFSVIGIRKMFQMKRTLDKMSVLKQGTQGACKVNLSVEIDNVLLRAAEMIFC